MSERLLESDFLTVDIRSILNKQKSTGNATDNEAANETAGTSTADENQNDTAEAVMPQTFEEWGEELKARLKANEEMSSEARQTDYEIESQFFKDFFNAKWNADIAKQLILIGEPLRKALKVLGFNEQLNPILAFITLPYVQKELLQTKLLNINTFKVIFNAVANKSIADSQFLSTNPYNIIYCKDLYTKSLQEMTEYLALQKQILPPTASKYTLNDTVRNRKVFFHIETGEQDPTKHAAAISKLESNRIPLANKGAILNSVNLVTALIDKIDRKAKKGVPSVHLSTKELTVLASKLNTHAQILAAILALSLTTDSNEAKKAISNSKFGEVSTENLIKATAQVATLMPKGKLAKNEADSLVKALLSKI